jgi:3-hydroxy-9,10-secoandrosta-1,3,5(10)-triene-9,17-dione monooxygenase
MFASTSQVAPGHSLVLAERRTISQDDIYRVTISEVPIMKVATSVASSTEDATAPSVRRFLEAATGLVPSLIRRADQCERERSAPLETIEEMKALGLLRVLQPARYGGFEMGWDVFCEITQILATGCGSQAWVYRVLGDHAQLIGLYPLEAQEDVWGKTPDALAASSLRPTGKARRVDGGYRLSGRYSFASGIDHAQWVIAGGMIEPDGSSGSKVEPHLFLVPRNQVTLVDDWFATGLEGTGSKSFITDDAFVPAHRALSIPAAATGTTPGAVVNHAPIYRLPRGGFTTSAFSALAVGMGKALVKNWAEALMKRYRDSPETLKRESLSLIAGQAGTDIDTAELLYLDAIRRSMAVVENGGRLTPTDAVSARRIMAYAYHLVVEAAQRVYPTLGAGVVYKGSSIERQYRNIIAGGQHIGVNWQQAAISYGVGILGGTPQHAPMG